MVRTWITAGAFALAAGLALVAPALAQDASPTPLEAGQCTVEQIPFDRLISLVASPVPQPTTVDPAATPPSGLPNGEAADDDTAQAVHDVIVEITACLNAGDLLRGLNLYSDRFLNEAFSGQPITQADYDQAKGDIQPRPRGSEIVLYHFSDVVILPDGRAAVSVLGDDLSSETPPVETVFFLIKQGDHWLIDNTRGA
jgi:hypothetical protein